MVRYMLVETFDDNAPGVIGFEMEIGTHAILELKLKLLPFVPDTAYIPYVSFCCRVCSAVGHFVH